jgi:hypothetical protein
VSLWTRIKRHLKVAGIALVFGLTGYAILMGLSHLAWHFGFHT